MDSATMTLTAGRKLGRYEILSPLGKGGMGEVYLARDTRLKRKVALKLLPAEFTSDADRTRRFEQEAQAASAISHPNIITIHEIGESNGTRFIAAEFVDGWPLRERMKGEPMSIGEAIDVVAQVASALSAAHAAGMIHRDIKPENIMVRADGLVKVLDFGLARLTEAAPASAGAEVPTAEGVHTETGVVLGTLRYMSPEQARGLKVDARSDIFSLGVVLYEIIAGRLPFAGGSKADVLVSILEKEPPPIARFTTAVPEALERIITRALRKDPERRYQTSKDLLIDLKDLRQQLDLKAKVESSAQFPASDQPEAAKESPTLQPAADDCGKGIVAPTTSSAEYIIGRIKRHKTGMLLVLLLLAAAAAAVVYLSPFSRNGDATESLAVLPFVNVGADPDTEYLSDGITDSLINSLSQLPNLKVMSRNSVFRYKGSETDAQKAGNALAVRVVLTGRVRQRGNDLHVSAELVDVRDNSHLWGEQYDRRMSDLLATQAELSRDISEKLRLRLSSEDKQRLTKRYTGNAEAYELYLKGLYSMNTLTGEGSTKSVEYFQRAIEKDPRYAPAYAGLAEYYAELGYASTTSTISPQEAFLKAKEAAVKAIEFDGTLAEAHTSLGAIAMFHDWDWAEAERRFKRAIALNPNYVNAHHWYSHCLVSQGRFEESLSECRRVLALDPLDVGMNFHLAYHYSFARQYEQAIVQLQKTLDIDRSYSEAHAMLGLVYEQQGRYREAVAELQKNAELGGIDQRGSLGHVYAISGQRAEAEKMLDQLREESKHKYLSPCNIARIYEGLGDKDQAFAWLEKAYSERDSNIIHLKIDPQFDRLHSDPRFADLLRRIGLQ